ncbi:hypothetical protein KY285_007701 [Solanum tuberosum]|nr:hypothetical protein KY285_007701 [Solanum tuberosum]
MAQNEIEEMLDHLRRIKSGGLSSLEYLQLWNSDCFESEEWCLGDITFHKLMFLNLTHLRISRCKNKPLEASALRIKDDVEENEGNDRIDLIIKGHLAAVSQSCACLKSQQCSKSTD